MEHTEMIVNYCSIRNLIRNSALSKKGLRTEQLVGKSRMDQNIFDNGSNLAVISQGLPVSNSNVFNLKTARDTTKFNRILQLPDGGRRNIVKIIGGRVGTPSVHNGAEDVFVVTSLLGKGLLRFTKVLVNEGPIPRFQTVGPKVPIERPVLA
jgi:hypothetical protein